MAQHKDRNKRPTSSPIDFSTVPEELRTVRNWVMWRFDWNADSAAWAKVPYQTDGNRAASDNPQTWSSFDSVMLTYEQARSSYDGIGFMFSGGYIGVDVDNCITDDDGEKVLSTFALRTMAKLDTYTEISPSGTGIHCIGRGDLEKGFNRTWREVNKIEGYSSGRYFTFTGISWDETPKAIREVQSDVEEILAAITKPEPVKPDASAASPLSLSFQQRLDIALKEPKVSALFHGATHEYGGDDSAADMALASKLAFYSGGDRDLADQMFRRSALMRPKWDQMRGHDTYGNITLDKALGTCKAFFGTKPAEKKTESSYDSRRLRRFTISDLAEKALEYYRNGQSQGVDPGWPELKEYYRPAKSMLSIVTGEPGSGKSNFVDCMCVKIALQHKWKMTFASFETLPIERHVLTLSQTLLQKPTFAWMQGAASERELIGAMEHLEPFFHFIMPADDELNIESLLEYVDDDIRDYGVEGFVLDPFTELEQSRFGGQTQTEMIEKILRKLQLFTRQRQIHTWLIAHPTKSGDTYRDGRPTMRSISGSANFYNKADFGLVIHRHEDDTTTLFVDKVRFDSNGGRGKVQFVYDKAGREYTPIAGGREDF